MKTMIQGKPLSAAVEKYRAEIWDSCKALWSVWVPAQLVNFAFVPRHMRIPFGTCGQNRRGLHMNCRHHEAFTT